MSANVLDSHALVTQLVEDLGARVTAVVAGVRDARQVYAWAQPDGPVPSPNALELLVAARDIWSQILDADISPDTIRLWFTRTNPWLAEKSPLICLREGRINDVKEAAHAFIYGTWCF